MDLKQDQILEEAIEEEGELTREDIKLGSITDGIIERSYLQSIKQREKEELGETRLGELTVALSLDLDNVPVMTIASKSDYLIEQFQDTLRKPHVQRPAIIDLPEEDCERIARLESVSVLNYLQKREKARAEEFERLENYESAVSSGSV